MDKAQVWPWLRPFLILVAVVSIPPLLYWFGYVKSSVEDTRRQANVTLSAIASSVKDRLEAHEKIAKLADSQVEAISGHSSGSWTDDQVGRLGRYLKSTFNTEDEFKLVAARRAAASSPSASTTASLGQAPPSDLMHLELSDGNAALYIHASYVDRFTPDPTKNKDVSCTIECTLRSMLKFENLIPWDLVKSEFDGLLVLDENRRLIAQDRRLPKQPMGFVMPLQGLPAHLASTTGNDQGKSATNNTIEKPTNRASLNPFDLSRDVTLELAGNEYIVFVQPVRVAVTPIRKNASDGVERPLLVTVCALIRKDRLRSEAIALSPQTLVFIGSLAAFGLFSIPFLKLRFIGPRERMRARDVWLLGNSLLGATALMVLLLMNVYAYQRTLGRLDDALNAFIFSVKDQFHDETTVATTQLINSAPYLTSENIPHEPDATRQGARKSPNSLIGSVLSGARAFDFQDFESLYAMDLEGEQTYKLTSRTLPTVSGKNADRDYFTGALTRPYVQSDAKLCSRSDTRCFFFEAIISRTTGSLLGVYSIPYSMSGRDALLLGADSVPAQRSGVIAITTYLRPVTDAVVPQPFQFLIVNHKGEVTFHHAQAPYTGEHFFESVPGGAALEQAARDTALPDANHDGNADAKGKPRTYRYAGHNFRMRAIYMPELESFVVAYYDPDIASQVIARTFGTAAVASLGIVLATLVGAALMLMWRGDRAFDWAWPAPARTGVYLLGWGIGVAHMLLLWLARSSLPPRAMGWYLVIAPFVIMIAMGSGYVVPAMQRAATALNLGANIPAWRSARCTSLIFQASAVFTLLSLIVWPTMIVFDDALTLHATAYENGVAHEWAVGQVYRREKLTEKLVNVVDSKDPPNCDQSASKGSPDVRCALPERTYTTSGNYDALRAYWREQGTYRTCIDILTDTTDCKLSLQGEQDEGKQDKPIVAAPTVKRLSFTYGIATVLASLHLDQQATAQSLDATAASTSPFPDPTPLFQWIGWVSLPTLGFVLLIFILCLLIGSIAQHVLGIGMLRDALLDESASFRPVPRSRWLLLRPNATMLDNITGARVTIDLRDPKLKPESLRSPAAHETLLLCHLESRLQDAAWRRALLKLLRADAEGCIVLVSEIDPLHYLTHHTREQEEALNALPADAAARVAADLSYREWRTDLASWALTLSEFNKVRRKVFVEGRFLNGTARRVILEKLCDECQANEFLIGIGQRLLGRPDINRYAWDDIVGFVLDMAEPYYRSLWELCSHEEKLVLIQLAQEGLVNPKRMELVQRLVRRGLLVVSPRLRPMNASFARFLRNVESREYIARLEHTATGLSWSRLGTPLYALSAVVIAILLFTQQDMLTNILGVVTAAGGTLGSLRNTYASVIKPVTSPVKVA